MMIVPVDDALLPAVVQLDLEVAASPWSHIMFWEEMQAGAVVLAGQADGKRVVAYGVIHGLLDEWHVMTLGVAPAWRRQGWGRRMMQHLLQQARQQGGSRAILEVAADNLSAWSLYTNLGFQEIGRRRDYYQIGDKRVDALVMALPLI